MFASSKEGHLGTEASWAAAGMLLPQVEADAQDDFFNLACQSRDLYPAFAAALREETGIDVELDTTGTLYLALTEHDQEEIEKRYDWQTRAGLSVELLSAAEARELEPCISESTLGALRFPKDIQVENRRLPQRARKQRQKLGVDISTETTVDSLMIEGNRVTGVQTARGAISSRQWSLPRERGQVSSRLRHSLQFRDRARARPDGLSRSKTAVDASRDLQPARLHRAAPGWPFAGRLDERKRRLRKVRDSRRNRYDTAKCARDFARNREICPSSIPGRGCGRGPLTVCLYWVLVVKLTGSFMQPGITETESYWLL